jgi:sulfofructose kinase
MTLRSVSVGHVALDLMFQIDAFPGHPTKKHASDFFQVVGGMSANSAVALSRLGAKAAFYGPIGDDAATQVFLQHFRAQGVDTRHVHPIHGQSNSISAIVTDAQGERMIYSHKGSALKHPGPFDAACLEHQDVVLTDPRCPDWAEQAMRLARRKGLPCLLDGEVSPTEDLQRLVPLAQWVVFSDPGLQSFHEGAHADGLACALDSSPDVEMAAVTLGADGLLWQLRGQPVQRMEGFKVPHVVDTTGAGDTFHGALALAWADGQPPVAALRFASAAAALKCTQPHSILGAPHQDQVKTFLAMNHPLGFAPH